MLCSQYSHDSSSEGEELMNFDIDIDGGNINFCDLVQPGGSSTSHQPDPCFRVSLLLDDVFYM